MPATQDHLDHHVYGHERPIGEIQLKVEGMTCAGCAATVQRALETLPGVESAAVNVLNGRATVTGRELDPNVMVRAIRDSGYVAQPLDDRPAPAELRSEIEQRQQHHERMWRRNAVLGLALWVPLEALHWIGHAQGEHLTWISWVLLIGSTIAIAVIGRGFYESAWNAAKRGTTNMDTLIAMGATTAYIFSLIVFIAQLSGQLHDQPLYFAESAALLGIISLGHWMEARATAKAGSAVRELLELQPDTAEIIGAQSPGTPIPRIPGTGVPGLSTGVPGLSPRIIPSAEVQPGDHLLIRPGGRVPVDGIVIEGESDVDQSVVTGESIPVRKSPGAEVVAGSMNTTGRLIIEAKVDGRHTTIARIAEMVQRAQTSKADIQRLADRIAAIFVPTVLLIALITFIGWWIAGDFSRGVISTVTVLIISCPCALGLATPMAVMVGAGAASKRGILIKSAMALETAGRATQVVFDKTGTLTSGAAGVTHIIPLAPGSAGGQATEAELLRLAAAVESPSEHPIGKAIVREATSRVLTIPAVSGFQAIPGQGVRGNVEGHIVVVIRDGTSTCRVEVDGRVIGTIMVSDQLRPDARRAIDQLRAMGLQVTMLTGDRNEIAQSIGAKLGLDPKQVIAEATPETKSQFVAGLSRNSPTDLSRRIAAKQSAGTIVMIGDGINDAAALAQADLGIAMAGGTNIAIESADVVIPGDRVTAVADTIDIARQTLRTIKQNLFFAFFYNAAAIPAAALGLLGPFGPLIAAAAMGLSDITVIGNAIRLKRRLSKADK